MKKITILICLGLLRFYSYGQTNILLSNDTLIYEIQKENFIWFGSDSLDMISIDKKKNAISIYNSSEKIIYIDGSKKYYLTGEGEINGLTDTLVSIKCDNINIIFNRIRNEIKIISIDQKKLYFDTKLKRRYKKKNTTNIYINK